MKGNYVLLCNNLFLSIKVDKLIIALEQEWAEEGSLGVRLDFN